MNDLLVMVQVNGRSAALRASDVHSVIEADHIFPVPRAPRHVVGLTAMRSQSLTVIDARIALGAERPDRAGERAVVVEVDGHSYALLVDRVDDVAEALSDPVPVTGGCGIHWDRVAYGMVETSHGPLLVIDPMNLVAGPERLAA